MDKCALITGATRGIGKQIAITLAKQGYNIALNYRKENEELENTKKEIEKMNKHTPFYKVTKESLQRLATTKCNFEEGE